MKKKHDSKYKLIAKAIIEYRKEQGITQKQLAEKLGVSISYISKIEAPNSEKGFSLEILFDISEELDVPVSNFFKYLN
ncbi:helix-turn-helix transcriptional regulator [Virgibacillus sp. 179-BFC.A HS]|uniref:Helix-turn-helix transcriptional regulator n=1 Tax=Tigheibacillus jepli TaxID=3035914 RepID=A0ABU5CGJ4_9BACI|nr:helix-turn-helix transcriptional regulator [Virgibacillus sp. 179-BFC.A HS]MDY0404665.1 helix-turn-helix transcriptional regulator [Virgibacillus sp. 179-BFC.A HS]